jgi:hypothetical protein
MPSQAPETTETLAAARAGALAQLVGSVPLNSPEEVFRAVAGELGARVRRIPDGETGDRTGWVGFQIPMLAAHESFEIVPSGQPDAREADLDKAEAVDPVRPARWSLVGFHQGAWPHGRRWPRTPAGRASRFVPSRPPSSSRPREPDAREGNRGSLRPRATTASAARAEGEDYTLPVFALRPGVRAEALRFGELGYARSAIASYATFARLKDAGGIGPDTRFQVSLPTPLALLLLFVSSRDQLRVEPAYKAALLRELDQIAAVIPGGELAVQWDIAPELALLEGAWESVFDDVEGELTGRFIELGNAVPASAQLGFHLCYGDLGHQHFVQPRDMSVLAALTGQIIAGLRRPLDWVHMPVPRDRDDDAYFAPLRRLRLPADTELFLGLIHATDGMDGARRRIAAAQRWAPPFGVATECGFGRRAPESIPALLGLHRAAADYLATTLGCQLAG